MSLRSWTRADLSTKETMASILILQDRALDRKSLATLLKSAGYVVSEASDGAEGLRLAERNPPDLVISDILMPTGDGYEFVRRLRSLPGSTHTPVIFYTATYHQREARSLAEECGVADILTKPSDPKAIVAKVNAVLTSGEKPATHRQDASDFSRDHLRVVSSALESKVEDLETACLGRPFARGPALDRFSLSPAANGSQKPPLAPDNPPSGDGPGRKSLSPVGRILVIDDDDLVRGVARRILRSAGHEVLESADGKAGVACYRQEQRVDLVITDILMPEQEGLETIRELRRVDSQVKIIATSGARHGDYLDLAVRFGARRILLKPFTRGELLDAVSEVRGT